MIVPLLVVSEVRFPISISALGKAAFRVSAQRSARLTECGTLVLIPWGKPHATSRLPVAISMETMARRRMQ